MSTMRLLLAQNHKPLREGLRELLEGQGVDLLAGAPDARIVVLALSCEDEALDALLEGASGRFEAARRTRPLTARERDVLLLLTEGRENSAIAARLMISPTTVKTHVAHLFDKLGVDNRVQAAVFAVRHGIV